MLDKQYPTNNTILTSNNIDDSIKLLSNKFGVHNIRIIGIKDKHFSIEYSRNVLKEASVTTNDLKVIILLGISFGLESQNALLKVLEETNKNVLIIILVNNINLLIPTIQSRMHKISWKEKRELKIPEDKLDYLNMSDENVINILTKFKRIKREELKIVIQDIIVLDGINFKQSFNSEDLDKITNIIKLINLNSNPLNLLTFLVMLLNKIYKEKNNIID